MQHLAPEGEPGSSRALIEFLRREICVDDCLDATARGVCESESRSHAQAHASGQGAKGGGQQAVLIAEIMRDQAWRDVGATGNLRQCAADIADLGETVDGDLDQLPPAALLQL